MNAQIYPIKLYSKKNAVLIPSALGLAVNILSWFWLLWQIPGDDEQLFLHYNILFGVDKVGGYISIFFAPLTGLLILILNYILGWLFYNRDNFLSLILNYTGLVCVIFTFIGALLLVFMNV